MSPDFLIKEDPGLASLQWRGVKELDLKLFPTKHSVGMPLFPASPSFSLGHISSPPLVFRKNFGGEKEQQQSILGEGNFIWLIIRGAGDRDGIN